MDKYNKKSRIIILCIAIVLPLIVGGLSALITKDNMSLFESINKPVLSPPAWLFPVAWTILYVLMGIASYFVYINDNKEDVKERKNFLILYLIQLGFNFFWTIIFFNGKQYLFAFIWLVFMWYLIVASMYYAFKVDKKAFYLLIPYVLWTTFAGYLNIMIAILN